MFDILKNNDIIITNNKEKILKYLNDNKKILNIKIMTLKEFKNSYYGIYDEKTIYYLINKYKYKYNVALDYLNNFLFDEKLKQELEEQNLIKKEPLFKQRIKRIIIDNLIIDDYIKKDLNNYEIIYLNDETGNYVPFVYEAKNIEEEVNFVALKILSLIDNIDKIHLVNVCDEYILPIKRVFNFYNIPINIEINKNIYSYPIVQKFLKSLKETKDIKISLENIEDEKIYDAILEICNRYQFKDIDDTIIYMIEEELKQKQISNLILESAVDIRNNVYDNDYYFVLGFNQGIVPKIYKDEDFIKDKQKEKLGILTSIEKNIYEKETLKKVLTKYPNIIITYKKNNDGVEYYPSNIIEELNLETKKIVEDNYNYSNLYNKIKLSQKLDNLIKFNVLDKDIKLLYNNYKDINYLKYDNSYKQIDKELLYKYIDNKLLLSYSSLDNYNRCGFKYYINNILNLNLYEETFMTIIGNLFHYILSICFNDNFNFEEEFNNYIKDKELDEKEKFFINKLKQDLLFTIETIKEQDKYTELNNALYEQKIYLNHDKNIKITFMGVIDKLKYKEIDNKTIVAIIDYKTGLPDINLNNLPYGIEMQLPIYLYLASNSKIKNVEIAGIYLQKIIHNYINYESGKNIEDEKRKKYLLEGYSNSNISVLKKFDNSYTESKMIKSLKMGQNGFYAYSKLLNNDQIEKIKQLVREKIEETENNIVEAKFYINPKKIGVKTIGCEYCKFKDICYKKEEDTVYLEEYKNLEFLV